MNKILERDAHWVTAIVSGRWIQAKVYDLPSSYGINNGRISKLVISKTDEWEGWDKTDYNFDRGLDYNHLDTEILREVISFLEELPPYWLPVQHERIRS